MLLYKNGLGVVLLTGVPPLQRKHIHREAWVERPGAGASGANIHPPQNGNLPFSDNRAKYPRCYCKVPRRHPPLIEGLK